MILKFTNPSAQARVMRMQELLRKDWMTRQQLASEFGMSARSVGPSLEYLIAFGGIEIKTKYGKTQYYRCVTANIVTFEGERKETSNARHIAAKTAAVKPFRDSLTMAFFGPRT